jgi:hypothetical protein
MLDCFSVAVGDRKVRCMPLLENVASYWHIFKRANDGTYGLQAVFRFFTEVLGRTAECSAGVVPIKLG